MFCIFDKDKNSSISLAEIKETLENYLDKSIVENQENCEEEE